MGRTPTAPSALVRAPAGPGPAGLWRAEHTPVPRRRRGTCPRAGQLCSVRACACAARAMAAQFPASGALPKHALRLRGRRRCKASCRHGRMLLCTCPRRSQISQTLLRSSRPSARHLPPTWCLIPADGRARACQNWRRARPDRGPSAPHDRSVAFCTERDTHAQEELEAAARAVDAASANPVNPCPKPAPARKDRDTTCACSCCIRALHRDGGDPCPQPRNVLGP